MHLAAVLVNNFTNAMYTAADGLLSDKLDFKLLLPLIQRTTAKLDTMSPARAQTGPAKRGDKNVMKKHLLQLKTQPELQKIYKEMSRLIKKQQHD